MVGCSFGRGGTGRRRDELSSGGLLRGGGLSCLGGGVQHRLGDSLIIVGRRGRYDGGRRVGSGVLRSEAVRQRYWARSLLGFGRWAAQPNAVHRAVAALERAGLVTGLIAERRRATQPGGQSTCETPRQPALGAVWPVGGASRGAAPQAQLGPRIPSMRSTRRRRRMAMPTSSPARRAATFQVPGCPGCGAAQARCRLLWRKCPAAGRRCGLGFFAEASAL